MAHARRKLFEAHEFNGSEIAGHAVALIAKLYEIEREARELEPNQINNLTGNLTALRPAS